MTKRLFLVWIATSHAQVVVPHCIAADPIELTGAACDVVSKRAENEEPVGIYADFANVRVQDAQEDWRRVEDMAKLNELAATNHPYVQAFLWNSGDATLVQFIHSSPSGDWVLSESHCFDGTGKLVRNVGTLNTFSGWDPETAETVAVSRVRTSYYDGAGQVIQSETRLLDLETKVPTPQRAFMDQEDIIYTNMSDLPFSDLIEE